MSDGMYPDTEAGRVQEYMERFHELEEDRKPWEPHWEEVTQYCHPKRDLWEDTEQMGDKSVKKGADLFDTRAVSDLQILANGLIGYNVGPTIRWFKLKLLDEKLNELPGVKDWLEKCEKVLYKLFHRSNFYDSTNEYYQDLASVGVASMVVEEDIANFQINFDTRHPKETYMVPSVTDRIDSVFRQFWLTGRNALTRYEDLGGLPEELAKDMRTSPAQKWRFLHVVHPREDRRLYSHLAIDKPWASVEMYTEGENILLETGYNQMPVLCCRWSKNSSETYGRSPAMDALAEMKRVNQEKKSQTQAGQLAVEPILQGPKQMLRKLKLHPFAFNTYKTPNERIYPLQTTQGYPFTRDVIDQAHEAIDTHFLTDLFLMLQRAERQMTAREIIERQGEKVAALSGPLTRQNHEFLGPVVRRTFGVAYRAGWLPPVPGVLVKAGLPIDVDFTGLLAQVQQRYQDSNRIDHGLSQVGAIAEMTQKIELWDNVDLDDLVRTIVDTAGFPQSSIREVPDRDKIRIMRQEEIEKQKQLAEAAAMAEMNPKLAEAPQPGSPGEALMNEMNAAAAGVAAGG